MDSTTSQDWVANALGGRVGSWAPNAQRFPCVFGRALFAKRLGCLCELLRYSNAGSCLFLMCFHWNKSFWCFSLDVSRFLESIVHSYSREDPWSCGEKMVYSSQSHRHRTSLTLSLNVACTYHTIEMQDVFVLLESSKEMQQRQVYITISAKSTAIPCQYSAFSQSHNKSGNIN
jgi:hypothetical protein